MAIMIPVLQPKDTRSNAEPDVYDILKRDLPDDYTVIHSLPWLCKAVRDLERGFAPTGEIDFVVIHPEYGVLALEVKGGRYKIEKGCFVSQTGSDTRDPVTQLRRNVHGVTKWIGTDPSLRVKFGYGFIFSGSRFGDAVISLAMTDISVDPPERIVVDCEDMPRLAERVREIMAYWRSAGGAHRLGQDKADRLIQTLCPDFDGTPDWGWRVQYDNQVWLRLTDEQQEFLELARRRSRMVVTGWPGTGKTVLGVELAREAAAAGRRTLVVVFNALLRDLLASRTRGPKSLTDVLTWHGLCSEARRRMKRPSSDDWDDEGAIADLRSAIESGAVNRYDRLVIDEAQVLKPEWLELLMHWFAGKEIYAFCDERQVFAFERETTSLRRLTELVGVDAPYQLTVVLRTPRRVTDRLKRVLGDVSYQLTSPRPRDPDALREVLSPDWPEALEVLLKELFSKGVAASDVVILSNSTGKGHASWLPNFVHEAGVQHHSVLRFRGLEAPIVIAIDCARMDDKQLVCAYSRATTAFIAIYDPHRLECPNGKFHSILLEDEDVQAVVQKTIDDKLTSSILAGFGTPVCSNTVKLRWSTSWKGWLIGLTGRGDPAHMWIDYLVLAHRWPVYYWHPDSRQSVLRVEPVSRLDHELITHRAHDLRICNVCEDIAPVRFGEQQWCPECLSEYAGNIEDPNDETFELLDAYDWSVRRMSEGNKGEYAKKMPLPLAAVATRLHGERKRVRGKADDAELPIQKTILYRAALAFTLARLAHTVEDIDRKDFASAVYRYYSTWDDVTEVKWQSRVSNAFGTCLTDRNLLTTVSTGVFRPQDDDCIRARQQQRSSADK